MLPVLSLSCTWLLMVRTFKMWFCEVGKYCKEESECGDADSIVESGFEDADGEDFV